MALTLTQLYQTLSDQIGKDAAESITNFMEEKNSNDIQNATKDLAKTAEMNVSFAEMKTLIEKNNVILIKWMVGFFITTTLMIGGLYAMFFQVLTK